MSTNSMSNVFTPDGIVCFVLNAPVIWRGMQIHRLCARDYVYYVECDEEVSIHRGYLTDGHMKIQTTHIAICKKHFIELLSEYLPEFKKE